jgi:hypothetical protein
MQRDELTAVGDLAAEAVAGIADQVHGVHDGIAQRVWSSAGPFAAPVRLAHDGIAAGVYGAVGWSLRTAVRAGARALGATAAPQAPSLQHSSAGRIAIGVLNGAVGDTLERRHNALALSMTLRRDGRDLDPRRAALRAEFPGATSKLAVFVHGVFETDDAWRLGEGRHPPYGVRLSEELGYTPLYIRYNTGREIAENGRELAALLARVSNEWPVEIHEIALIGHAMGGLVSSTACDYDAGRGWTANLTNVLTLGAPDRGALLERAAKALSAVLARTAETQQFAKVLERRSAGIKELRRGHAIPYLGGARHFVIDIRRLGGIHHFQLLNDPGVYEQIRALLASRPALPQPPRALPAGTAQRP